MNPLVLNRRIISLNYSPYIPHLTKNVPPTSALLVPLTTWSIHMGCPTLHANTPFGGNPVDGRGIPPNSKKVPISNTKKIPLTKSQFSSNHLIQASFIAAVIVILFYHFFNFRSYIQIYHANFD